MSKLIITVASTSSLYSKIDTPYIPLTARKIAKDVKECYDSETPVVHMHARDITILDEARKILKIKK